MARVEDIWTGLFVELVAKCLQDLFGFPIGSNPDYISIALTTTGAYAPLNVICANVHNDELILEDDLVVKSNVAFHVVARRQLTFLSKDGDFGEATFEILLGQLADDGQAFATRAYLGISHCLYVSRYGMAYQTTSRICTARSSHSHKDSRTMSLTAA